MWKNPSPHLSLVVKVLLAAPTEAFFVDVENFYEKRLGAINPIEIIRNFPISMKKLVISYGNELNHKRSLPTFSKSSKTLLSIPYKVSRHRGQLGFRSNQGPWSHFKKKQLMLLSIGGWFFFSKTSKKVDVFCWMAFCLNVISAIFWVSGEYTRYGRMNLRGHVVCHFSWVPLDMPTFRTSLLIFLFTLGMFFETRIRSKQKKGDHSWTQRRG